MGALLISLLRTHWQKAVEAIFLLALVGTVVAQHEELAKDRVKLFNAAALHDADQGRIASLRKELSDQNDAVTALQAAQTQKEQTVERALVVAKVQQQKVVTLLASTENKKPSTCEEAMPDVKAILKELQQ